MVGKKFPVGFYLVCVEISLKRGKKSLMNGVACYAVSWHHYGIKSCAHDEWNVEKELNNFHNNRTCREKVT
jgi:hypothetical protein